ncbi:hypothetical protein R75461_04622 [Paraburkholderia nemoris]|nr:hypothetical protein R75461_04622 [Paraburkholderia nemoris]
MDAVPFVCVRLFGVGAVRRTRTRCTAGGRAVLECPRYARLSCAAARRACDGAEPDAVGVRAADAARSGMPACGRRVDRITACSGVRRREARTVAAGRMDRRVRCAGAGDGEHVRHHGNDGARDVPSAAKAGDGSGCTQRDRRGACRSATARAGRRHEPGAARSGGRTVRGRSGSCAWVSGAGWAERGAVRAEPVGNRRCAAVPFRRRGTARSRWRHRLYRP